MAKNDNLTDFLTDVANAIRAKKGMTGLINPQNFSAEIASIPTGEGGGGGTESGGGNDVQFIDYDGTILHSYSKADFLALTALPALPSKSGLICQGWNWDLEDAKAYVEKYGKQTIGASYITDDGKTRLYIRIAAEERMTVPLYFQQSVANGVTIDWGDGSASETLSGTGAKSLSHSYAQTGDYVISLTPSDKCTLTLGYSTNSILGSKSTSSVYGVYRNMLQRAELGGNTTIAAYSFAECYSLASVVIPEGVTSIGNYAFQKCNSLASVVIPASVTSIGTYAFSSCYSLASVVIPEGVTTIADHSFQDCNSLASVVIPEGVTSIDNYAFQNCYSLASVVIPASVTSIGTYVFTSCYSLASVVIPASVTSIGNYAFQNCYSLASVVIPASVTSIGNYAFSSCYSLASVVIPEGVTSIGNYAFQKCNSLASVVIPEGVTSIGTYAFSSCYSLASVVIPASVTSIGTYAFSSCYSLASVVIPASVTSIGNSAFYTCYGMAIYDFSRCAAVPTLGGTSVFGGIPSDCKIVVPDALYDTWIAATNWSTHAAKIIKASEYNV